LKDRHAPTEVPLAFPRPGILLVPISIVDISKAGALPAYDVTMGIVVITGTASAVTVIGVITSSGSWNTANNC
jgi:hypothetical protein